MTLSPKVKARIDARVAELLKDARPPTEAQLKVLRRVFGPRARHAETEPASDGAGDRTTARDQDT